MQMLKMQGSGSAIDQYIIKEHQYKLSQIRPEQIIHGHLEDGGDIGKSERHYSKLSVLSVCETQSFVRFLLRLGFGDSLILNPIC